MRTLHRKDTQRVPGIAAVLLLLSASIAPILLSATPALALPLDFTVDDISATADNAQQVVSADIDGDGDNDLASASQDDDTVAWYENTAGDGSAWTAANIGTTADGARAVDAADLDGDGDIDLISASHDDDTVAWYENTAGDGSSWTATDIAASVLIDGASSVEAADVDGDGDLDLAVASLLADRIAWLENTVGDASTWDPHNVSIAADGATSVVTGDIDGDGDLDLASASQEDDTIAWYENTAGDGSAWTPDDIAVTADGAQSVAAGDVDGDGDLDLASASQGDDTIAWYENTAGDGSAWTPDDISTTADGARSVSAADLDADGDVDLASASSGDNTVAWYENTAADGSAWTEDDLLTTAGGASSVTAADVDGDGDLDLGSAHSTADTVAWLDNALPARSTPSWDSSPIEVATDFGPESVSLGDLDSDGDLDVLTARQHDDKVTWSENTEGGGTAWTHREIGTGDAPMKATTGDIDGDGDLDVIAGYYTDATVFWYENTGNPLSWPATEVSDGATGVRDVIAADLDGDGDLDIASADSSDSAVGFHENTNGDGTAWTSTDLSSAPFNGVAGVVAGDLDGDGDLDLASATITYNRITWYENTNGDGSNWAIVVISNTHNSAKSIDAADLDGDGDLDLAATSWSDKVAWYENTSGDASTWVATDIDTDADSGESLVATDLDGDGDGDLVGASSLDDTVAWYENTAGDGSAWAKRQISTSDGDYGVAVGDIDRDGDPDVASAASQATTWHEALPTITAQAASTDEGEMLGVTLSAGRIHEEVEVDFSTVEGTAEAGADFTALVDAPVTITPPATSTTVDISTTEDAIDENNETFSASLTNPVGAGVGSGPELTIVDDDPTPEVTIDNVTVTEKNDATVKAEFTIELSGLSSSDVTLDAKTTQDTAKKDVDYTHKDKTVTIAAGESTETFSVTVKGDKIDEENEKFFVDLSSADNAVFGDDRGKGTITDNDDKPKLSIDNETKDEGNSGKKSFTFKVKLDRESGKTVEVDYKTESKSAKSPSDFVFEKGTLTFKPGVTKKEIVIKVKGDKKDEGKEKFLVKLSDAVKASLGDKTGEGIIRNDD